MCSPNTYAYKVVFNPNIPIFPPNFAEGLHFSAFHYKRTKKHFLNEQRNRDDAAKKRANTSGVGESNNYYEDIYNIPPYNNTH